MMTEEEKKKELDRRVKKIGEMKKEFFHKLELELFEDVALLQLAISKEQSLLLDFLRSFDSEKHFL